MRHIRFVVQGKHPLLYLVRDSLILSGYHLVDWNEDPEFCVWGGLVEPTKALEIPVLHLSSSCVYTALDTVLESRPKGLMSEDWPLLIPSSLDLRAWMQASYIKSEAAMLCNARHVMVLRPFNVYGPNINHGIVHNLLDQAAHDETLTVLGSGYEVRSFLHEEDFLTCVKKSIKRLLKLRAGIFNVGNNEEITLKNLAESIVQLTGKDLPIEIMYARQRIDSWKLADTTRIRAFVRWQPKTTIRRGIWRLLHDTSDRMGSSTSTLHTLTP